MDKRETQNTAKVAAGKTAGGVSRVLRAILKVVVTLLLIIVTTSLLFACIFAYYVKTDLSDNLDVSLDEMTLNLASTISYKDTSGNNVSLATLHGKENRVWVDYKNIPTYMSKAAVSIEDKRFYEHKGVDWYRTVAAFGNMFLSMKNDFGGSTITQQLIKNLTKENDITVQRKILEIFRALKFERMYNKDEIMEWYLNVIYLGESCNGVGTAAKTYFDKDVWDLDLAECASIIGITNNPSKYDPYISRTNNKERQEVILKEMYSQGFITNDQYTKAVAEQLVFKRAEDESYSEPINSYYVDTVIEDVKNDLMKKKGINAETAENLIYNGGLQIYSCYDPKAQQIVDSVYQDASNFPTVKSSKGESVQSAVVLVDPHNGDIKALYGGVGKKNGNLIFNRAVDALRPPGSTIKPLTIYGPALDQGLISPTTLVNDSPDISLKGTSWFPKNASGTYSGVITIQQALTNSINTVSAQILDKLTPSVAFSYLTQRLGATNAIQADCDYAPLALGQLTKGITVREMAQAYDSFVNDGVFTYARTYTQVTDSQGNIVLDNPMKSQVAFKANTAWTMDYMLNIAATYGTGSESYLGNMPHAGKTGSSNDYCDRWFVGFTPYYCAAVWTGYDTPEHLYVSGNPAAQIWKKIMYPLNDGLVYKDFTTPTLSGPTNIFGNLYSGGSASKEPSESTSPSVSSDVSGSKPATSSAPAPSPSKPVESSQKPEPQTSNQPNDNLA